MAAGGVLKEKRLGKLDPELRNVSFLEMQNGVMQKQSQHWGRSKGEASSASLPFLAKARENSSPQRRGYLIPVSVSSFILGAAPVSGCTNNGEARGLWNA